MPDTLHTHTDDAGLMTVRFDQPDRPVNTFTPDALDELDKVIRSIESGEVSPTGIVFASAKPDSFVAGADLHAMREMTPEQVQHFLEHGQSLFDRIAKLDRPTVAVINGHCMGGGLELALACRARVAVDDGRVRIGLPETKLGLLPGWGGTTRLTEMLGPVAAMRLMLPGRTLAPRKALAYGLIDEVVRPEVLDRAAARLTKRPPPRRQPSRLMRAAQAVPALRRRIFQRARHQSRAQTHGNYPATDRLIDVVQTVVEQGHDAGLTAEREHLLALTGTDACRNLMRLFFLRQQAKHAARDAASDTPKSVDHAAVVGGGTMGAGIAHALITAGIAVRLIEVSPEAVSATLRRVQRLLDADLRAKHLSPLQAKQAMHRLSPSTDWTGLRLADIAIEAVLEKPAIKREVFEKLGQLTRNDAVLATNTSAQDITPLADAAGRPARVIGLHFFNPVAKMPLVEVVRTLHSAGGAVATGVALAQRTGKTAIVVNHGPGFLVNRLLLPYLAEALLMLGEGHDPDQLDRAMRRWGMPMGPCELLDHVGLDVTVDILDALQPRLGDRFVVPDGLETAVERGWLGVKTGRGLYIYPTRRLPLIQSRPRPNRPLLRRLHNTEAPTEAPDDEAAIQRRLVLPMINEAARVLVEGITDSTDTIDLATVLGLGLAPFRGGLAHHAETIGLSAVTTELDTLAQLHGPRFAPLPELRQLGERNEPLQRLVNASRAAERAA